VNWPLVRVDSVSEINPRLPKGTDEAQEVSFLGMASVSEDGYLLDEELRVLSDTKKGFTYFAKGDVLLAKITPCFENGKCLRPNQITNNIGFGSTEFHVIRASEEHLDSKYLFYMLWSDHFRLYGRSSMSGAAGQKRVSADFIKGYQIPLPPLKEQKRIAAILDKADNLRLKRHQAIQLADEFLRAVFLDMFGDPVTNPKGWKTSSLSNHGSFKNGLNFSKGESGVSVNYLGVGDFKSLAHIEGVKSLSSISLNFLPADSYLLKDGDIVFVRSNGNKALVGRCISVYPDHEKVTFSGFCIRYRIENMDLNTSYLNYLFRMPSIKHEMLQGGQGANIQNINQGILTAIKIPVPPRDLQSKFMGIVDSFRSSEVRSFDGITKSKKLFGSISQKAFSGQL
jgi:type I restriction enzyme S subunit